MLIRRMYLSIKRECVALIFFLFCGFLFTEIRKETSKGLGCTFAFSRVIMGVKKHNEESNMTTEDAIKKQFLELYQKEEYAKISVKELCASTPVARTTFYAYYDNIDDVMREIENELINGITQITNNSKSGSRITLRSITRKLAKKMNR